MNVINIFYMQPFFKSKSLPEKKCLLWKYEFFGAPCLVGLLAVNQRHIAVYREPLPGFLLVVEVLEGTGTDCLFPYYFTFITLSRLLLYLGLHSSAPVWGLLKVWAKKPHTHNRSFGFLVQLFPPQVPKHQWKYWRKLSLKVAFCFLTEFSVHLLF